VNSFKVFFERNAFNPNINSKGDFVKSRHLNITGVPDHSPTSRQSKNVAKFVPDSHRTIHSNNKLKALLNNGSTAPVKITDADVRQIEAEFPPVKYDPSKPKKLGNTGVVLRYDHALNSPVIEKPAT
jgi:hypothetical protein